MLAGLMITVFFLPKLLYLLIPALVIKTIFEIQFLLPAKHLLEDRHLLRYYPLTVIPHIFYVAIFPLLGLLMPKRW
jgi:hypothetical protein